MTAVRIVGKALLVACAVAVLMRAVDVMFGESSSPVLRTLGWYAGIFLVAMAAGEVWDRRRARRRESEQGVGTEQAEETEQVEETGQPGEPPEAHEPQEPREPREPQVPREAQGA